MRGYLLERLQIQTPPACKGERLTRYIGVACYHELIHHLHCLARADASGNVHARTEGTENRSDPGKNALCGAPSGDSGVGFFMGVAGLSALIGFMAASSVAGRAAPPGPSEVQRSPDRGSRASRDPAQPRRPARSVPHRRCRSAACDARPRHR